MTVSNTSPSDFTLIQISDTHLMQQDHLEFAQVNPAQSFQAILADIQQRYPQADAIIHTGDIAQDAVSETYQYYLKSMQKIAIPHFHIPGNHDDCQLFPFYHGHDAAHAVHFGQWTLILLNSAVKDQIYGSICDAQLQQLQQLLAQYPHQHIIISCHHHPVAMQSAWIDQHILKNSNRLTQILSEQHNVKLVLFGHVHQDSYNLCNGIHFYSTPSTCIQFKPQSEHFALDQAAPGYRVLHLKKNGDFETKIQRIDNAIKSINLNISGY